MSDRKESDGTYRAACADGSYTEGDLDEVIQWIVGRLWSLEHLSPSGRSADIRVVRTDVDYPRTLRGGTQAHILGLAPTPVDDPNSPHYEPDDS